MFYKKASYFSFMEPIVGTLAKLYLEGALGRVYRYACVYIFVIRGVVLLFTCVCLNYRCTSGTT